MKEEKDELKKTDLSVRLLGAILTKDAKLVTEKAGILFDNKFSRAEVAQILGITLNNARTYEERVSKKSKKIKVAKND